MAVPQYGRSRAGRVYRIYRSSALVGADCLRFTLRAVPVAVSGSYGQAFEASREVHTELVRDKIRHRQVIPTPEATFEQLWQQLRLDIDAV
jgi:hypothetical protein